MSKIRATVKDEEWTQEWSDPSLGEVITLAEASLMFHKSTGAIKQQIFMERIIARKSFTGGQWLINLASIVAHYGKPTPERDVLSCRKKS